MMLTNFKNPGLLLLMSVMTCLLVLVACGSSSTSSEDAKPAATKAPAAPKVAATAVPKIVREASTPVPKAEKVSGSGATAKPAGTLQVGQKELGTFQGHPRLAVNPALFVQQTAPISEGLITITADRQVIGSLVESWSISEDYSTWRMNIRKGVEFHKGYGEMTAEDVAWSYSEGWAKNEKHAARPDFEAMWARPEGKVTIVAEFTLDVDTGEPLSELVVLETWMSKTPSGRSSWVTSKKQSDEVGEEAANRDIAGTGPWEMMEHKDNEFWRMNAVQDHWRQTPHFAELIFREVPEESARLAGFQTGQLDTFLMAFDTIPAIEKVEGAKLMSIPGAIDFGMNIYGGYYAEAFSDDLETPDAYDPEMPWISPTPDLDSEEWERARKVREALAISVDRQSIIDTLMRGFAKPIPLWLFGAFGQPHLDGRLWDYDPDRAKTLLEEAGYGDGFSITLTPSLRGAPAEVEACEVIAQMWEDIGLDVQFQKLPYSTLRPTMVARTYKGATCHAAGTRVVTAGSQNLLTSKAAWNPGSSHPWMDEHMPKMDAAVDPDELHRLEKELAEFVFDNAMTYVGLYAIDAIWPVGPRIEKWSDDVKFTDLRNLNGYEYIRPRE